jgi:septum formation protein
LPELVLASASPRRAELLRQLGIPFRSCPSKIIEVPECGLAAPDLALLRARQKAHDVAARFPEELVLGADTVVCYEGRILDKPQDHREALEMLAMLSGRGHDVSTGVVLFKQSNGDVREAVVTTRVTFRRLSQQDIAGYLATGEPFDKAGGYGIQGFGALLVEKIDGCYFNVVGLPLARLGEMLKSLGVDLLCPDQNIT